VNAFVNWARALNNPAAPLGTIELLTSPAQEFDDNGHVTTVDPAMLANVVDSFDAWKGRCNANAENVAVFYFCGHGVEKDTHYLLLEDFAKVEDRLLENSIDLNATLDGMAKCKASSQYFFIDACREVPHGLLKKVGGRGKNLIEGDVDADTRSAVGRLSATVSGAKAYGVPNSSTLFTDALIRALNGLGSRKRAGSWAVTFNRVSEATTLLLQRQAPPQNTQSSGSGDGAMHVLTEDPLIPVVIRCDPEAAASVGSVELVAVRRNDRHFQYPSSQGGWLVDVPAAYYTVALQFPNGEYSNTVEQDLVVNPPLPDPLVVGVV
jgi:hypothetical protein